MESTKSKFLTNPNKNPKTGEDMKIGGKKYKKLEEKYGVPKIKSPKTQKKIGVNKGEYKKLIKEGYTDDQLLYGKEKEEIHEVHEDIMYNLLLQSNFKTIKFLCLTNKAASKICNDNKFWEVKFVQEQLPLFNHELTPRELYMKTAKSIKDANDILYINKFEYNRPYNKTKGIISLFLSGEYEESDLPYLPKSFYSSLKNQFDDINSAYLLSSIVLTYINDKYNLKCTVLDQDTENFYDAEIEIDELIVKDILVKFLFDMNTHDFECTDDANRPFTFEPEFIIEDFTYPGSAIFYIRRGLWESLNF